MGIVPSASQGEGKQRHREYKGQRINGHNQYAWKGAYLTCVWGVVVVVVVGGGMVGYTRLHQCMSLVNTIFWIKIRGKTSILSNLHYKDTKGQRPRVRIAKAFVLQRKRKCRKFGVSGNKRTVCDWKVSMKRNSTAFSLHGTYKVGHSETYNSYTL